MRHYEFVFGVPKAFFNFTSRHWVGQVIGLFRQDAVNDDTKKTVVTFTFVTPTFHARFFTEDEQQVAEMVKLLESERMPVLPLTSLEITEI